MSENPPNPLDSLLTEFALGPSWARAKSEPSAKQTHESPEREHPQRRREARGENRGRREGGERHEGGERRGQRDGGNRRDFQQGRGRGPEIRREEFIAPAEGVTVTIVPDKAAIQLVCKEIQQVARVYPLFDIAEIILAERSRCRAFFEISEIHEPFFRCKLDDAVFLTKEEALRHLLDSPWKNRFISETTVETDPPKGNFQSVARCGISGKLLGPPNYHGYQTEIRRVHREFFQEMPFESYLAKVRTDRSEDAVGAWMDSMKNQTRWRILSDEESKAVAADLIRQAESKPEPTPAAEESVAEDSIRPAENEPEPTSPTEETTPPAESAEEPVSEEKDPAPEEPATETSEPEPAADEPAAPEVKWFTDRAEFERALVAEVLSKAYQLTRKAKVSAAIPAKNLSPGLFARLKATGTHHRKHPAIIIPEVCKLLESEHMPVFKRKGKLFTGPARPSALALNAVLADRPAQMVKWIRENPPAKLEGLWLAMLPEGSTAPPQGYAADLFWLLQQGHILLYTDDTLVVQDPPKPQEPKKPKQPKKKAAVAATEQSEMAGQDKSSTSPANCIRPAEITPSSDEKQAEAREAPSAVENSATPPAESEPAPEEQLASGEPSPETSEGAPEEAPPAITESTPEPIKPSTEASETLPDPEETPAENKAAPEPAEASNEPAPEEEPAKDPLP